MENIKRSKLETELAPSTEDDETDINYSGWEPSGSWWKDFLYFSGRLCSVLFCSIIFYYILFAKAVHMIKML
jgi:hypothetical protein